MARASILIGDRVFRTKQELTEYCRSVLYSYTPGETLSAAHTEFLLGLIERHREYVQKVGAGVERFTVESDGWGRFCFWIHRVDGTDTDVSFVECIRSSGTRQDFTAALRHAVADQVIDFRHKHFQQHADPDGFVSCPLTGEKITRLGSHVDHEPPLTFLRIVRDFIAERNLDIEAVAIGGKGDGEMKPVLLDAALKADWSDYHRRRARLRVTSRIGNLSHARREPQMEAN